MQPSDMQPNTQELDPSTRWAHQTAQALMGMGNAWCNSAHVSAHLGILQGAKLHGSRGVASFLSGLYEGGLAESRSATQEMKAAGGSSLNLYRLTLRGRRFAADPTVPPRTHKRRGADLSDVVIGCGPIASMEDACMEASKALHALGKLAMTSDVTDCLDLRDGAKLFGKNGISQVLRRLEKEGRVKMEKMKGTREGYDRQAYTLTDKGRAKLPPPPSPEPQPEAPTRAWTDPWTAREAVDNVLKLNADLQARFDGLEHVLGERDRQLAERDQQLQDEREAHQRTLARLEDDLELAEMEIEDYKKRLASQEPRCTPEQMDALIALGLPVT